LQDLNYLFRRGNMNALNKTIRTAIKNIKSEIRFIPCIYFIH
jgi:hypothetical protein